LSAKKSCSPAVQMNSLPQSTHASVLSWNSMVPYLSPTRARPVPAASSVFEQTPPRERPALAGPH
jgi:hypothetical protein